VCLNPGVRYFGATSQRPQRPSSQATTPESVLHPHRAIPHAAAGIQSLTACAMARSISPQGVLSHAECPIPRAS
jgi:hypothetical protein